MLQNESAHFILHLLFVPHIACTAMLLFCNIVGILQAHFNFVLQLQARLIHVLWYGTSNHRWERTDLLVTKLVFIVGDILRVYVFLHFMKNYWKVEICKNWKINKILIQFKFWSSNSKLSAVIKIFYYSNLSAIGDFHYICPTLQEEGRWRTSFSWILYIFYDCFCVYCSLIFCFLYTLDCSKTVTVFSMYRNWSCNWSCILTVLVCRRYGLFFYDFL